MYRPRLIRWLLAAVATLGLAQCKGGDSQASLVGLVSVPDSPIVITADTEMNGVKVKGPWFKFRVTVSNQTNTKLTIVALTAKVYAPNSQNPKDWAVDPSTANATTDNLLCNFDSFGTWDPGSTKSITLDNGNSACKVENPFFVVSGLDAVPGSNNYRYRVVLKPVGWFGEGDNLERFDKTITFYTR